MGDAVVQQPFFQCPGHGLHLAVASYHMGGPVFISHVVHYFIFIKGTVHQLPVQVVLPFNDLHDLPGTVFQLFGEHHHRVCLHHDLHQDGIVHAVLPLGKGHHTPVGALAGIGVDGGADRVAGTGAFRRRQALCH